MTRQEFGSLIAVIRSAYRDNDFLSDNKSAEVWYGILKDLDFATAKVAVTKLITTHKWLPTIAEILDQVRLLNETVTDSNVDTELWSLIVKASKNSTYGAVEEFQKLPEECQRFLGSPTVLKDFGQIDQGTLQTVVKGHFLKTIPAIRKHTEYKEGLPMEVRLAIEDSKQKMLGDGLIG